jgi:ParB family transcriptional regulator, chromosome partitioning protein
MAVAEEHKPVEKRRALGRGLDSLLPSGPRAVPPPAGINPPARIETPEPPGPRNGAAAVSAQVAEIHVSQNRRDMGYLAESARTPMSEPHGPDVVQQMPLDLIDRNPYQTRNTFDEAALNELAESIKAHGLAQPVVVRPGANGRYVLVLGERRCRASKLAGKATVAAIVHPLGNEQAAEMTIVENLQRQDLNCLEQAQAFARLSREFNLTQEQIGQRTGVSRESVANYMRLLKLPKPVLDLIAEGKLGFSEARVLLEGLPHSTPQQIEIMAATAAEGRLTVRDLKRQIDGLIHPELDTPEPRPERRVDPNVADAERRLREALGMRVRVLSYKGNKGQIVIRYESLADFDRVLDLLEKAN